MPRFVLLRHECPAGFEKPSHWDLMLEQDGVLLTWELRVLPSAWVAVLELEHSAGTNPVAATRLSDHRLSYLDYEGPVSRNRGTVSRVAEGTYTVITQSPTLLELSLDSTTINGLTYLEHIAEAQWRLAFHST